MRRISVSLLCWLALLGMSIGLIGCGSSEPTGPSSVVGGPTLIGNFSTNAGGQGSLRAFVSNDVAEIRVEVREDPSIVVAVSNDGTFALRGLPEGEFTVLFYRENDLIGEQLFATVLPNMEIEIRVELSPSGEVRLLSERRTGIGHVELEIEGLITSVTGQGHDGLIEVNGFRIRSVAGTTAIREGNRARTIEDLRRADRVHVKGQGEGDSVLAFEIKIQRENESTDGVGGDSECSVANGKITICHKQKNTLSVAPSAWPAHKAHGDTCGPCSSSGS